MQGLALVLAAVWGWGLAAVVFAGDSPMGERWAAAFLSALSLTTAALVIAYLVTWRLSESDRQHKISDGLCEKMEDLIIVYFTDGSMDDGGKRELLRRFFAYHAVLLYFVKVDKVGTRVKDGEMLRKKCLDLFDVDFYLGNDGGGISFYKTMEIMAEIRHLLSR